MYPYHRAKQVLKENGLDFNTIRQIAPKVKFAIWTWRREPREGYAIACERGPRGAEYIFVVSLNGTRRIRNKEAVYVDNSAGTGDPD